MTEPVAGRPVISMERIARTFHTGTTEVRALNGVSFEVAPGELLAIIGPSGSGKSTLMNLLGCLDSPSAGKYLLNGEDVSGMSDDRLAEVRNRYIGFVFQSYNLLTRATALENVLLPLNYSRSKDGRALAVEALERVGLGHRLSHKPPELSGGEQQRVGIARALVNSPRLILADEPTGNLDSRSSASIMRLLQDLNRRDGVTIILVTHDHDVAAAADRIVAIRDGVIESDEPNEARIVEPDSPLVGAVE